jgi:parallel beta-helix repeat protein
MILPDPIRLLTNSMKVNPTIASFNKFRSSLTIALPLLIICSPAALARNYYVSIGGNDSNDGSIANPLASIQEAAYRTVAGDRIYIRGGTYKPTDTISFGGTGTVTQRIVVESYPNEKVVIDGSLVNSQNPYPHTVVLYGSYIDFKGIEVANSRSVGIMSWQGSNIRVLNNIVRQTQGTGISLLKSNNVVVAGNTVYQAVLENKPRQPSRQGGWGMGISSGQSSQVSIIGNKSYRNYGEGIGCYLSKRCSIVGNEVYDNFSVEIYLDNTTNSRVSQNLVYNTGNPEFFRYLGSNGWMPSSGLQMANENYGDGGVNKLNNNLVDNNIVINGSYSFFYGDYDLGGGLKNTRIINNTFYGATLSLLFLSPDSGHEKTVFANNIWHQTNGKNMSFAPDVRGLKFNSNLWYGGSPSGNLVSPTDVFSNPLLVFGGGKLASNYKLKAGSPAIDRGNPSFSAFSDYFNTRRPVGRTSDIGAHEYNGSR